MLAAWRRSGLAAHDFAVHCGVSHSTLHRWKREARRFVEVGAAASDVGAAESSGTIEIVLPGGAILRLGPEFDEDVLRRAVRALTS